MLTKNNLSTYYKVEVGITAFLEKFEDIKGVIRCHIQRRRDNTMVKKERQYNGQEGETIQWSKEKGHKDKQ